MEKFKERPRKKSRPERGLLYGVGIQDAPYITRYRTSDGKEVCCPFFARWKSMLKRCYNSLHKHPSYEQCVVCEGWLTFSKFKAWMETQDWEGKQLDKDLLVVGNKVYSPEHCVFVLPIVNMFLTENKSNNKSGKVGAFAHVSGGFQANCNNPFTGKIEYLGYYHTLNEAHFAWGVRKHELAHEIVKTYNIDNDVVVRALLSRYEKFEKSKEEKESNAKN